MTYLADIAIEPVITRAIGRYFGFSRSARFMSMQSLSTAISGNGHDWGTKECFDWCQRNTERLKAMGLKFRADTWGLERQ